jgi:hypothetical protein
VAHETADRQNVAAGFGITPEGADAMAAAFQNHNRQTALTLTQPRPAPTTILGGERPRTGGDRFDVKPAVTGGGTAGSG